VLSFSRQMAGKVEHEYHQYMRFKSQRRYSKYTQSVDKYKNQKQLVESLMMTLIYLRKTPNALENNSDLKTFIAHRQN
jgi:hypothetical protein